MLRSGSGKNGLIFCAQAALRFVKVRLRKDARPQKRVTEGEHRLVAQFAFKTLGLHQTTFEYFPDTQPTCPLMTMAFQPLRAVATWSNVMPALTVVMTR